MKRLVASSRNHQVTTSLPLSVASERLSSDILYTPKSTEKRHMFSFVGCWVNQHNFSLHDG